MVSKTISITEEVYELLSSMKMPHESFGDVIKRLCEEKTAKSLVNWVSGKKLWSDMSKDEYEQVQSNINGVRKKLHVQEVKLD
ncbi:MAG: antitoxin VapB family protein [Candidatus Hodarchaeales archaeon]|jgi:predicted CopG family antitoxin